MNNAFLKKAESLVLDLLKIPGPSGEEQKVMEFLVNRLRKAGAPDDAIRFDRPGNLVLRLPGSQPGKRRLLSAHVDTVALCRGARPVRRGGYIVPADKNTALGADDRSGTAVLLAAATEILRRPIASPAVDFPMDGRRRNWHVRLTPSPARFARTSAIGVQL